MKATTNKVAGNLNGMTIHSLVQLPVKKMWVDEKLSSDDVALMRKKFEGKKLLIIDEMSMLS